MAAAPFADVVERVRAVAHRLAEHVGEELGPALVVVRDGRAVAVATHADRPTLLGAAGPLAAGLGAEALGLLLVGVVPLVPTNPLTGEPWAPGEAAAALRDDAAAARGWVREMLLLSVVGRGGDRSSTAQAFRAGPDATEWDPDVRPVRSDGPEAVLARALEAPPVDPARMPVEPGRARVALDVGTVRAVDSRLMGVEPAGGAMLVVPDGATLARYETEGLLSWQHLLVADTP